MSKLLMIVERTGNNLITRVNKSLNLVTGRIIPDIILPNDTKTLFSDGFACYVFNPMRSVYFHENSVCLGYLVSGCTEWWLPQSELPDGTYALFRSTDEHTEVITDMMASRSIWYYMDNEIFIASTSQRAIIMCLGNYHAEDKVVPWILFSGITGPDHCWDRRIRMLPGNTTLLLDRKTWTIKLSTIPPKYNGSSLSYDHYMGELRDILYDLLMNSEIDYDKWVLTLSGGYDSRGLLLFLKDKPGLKTVTWGLEKSTADKNNDAYIAKAITAYYGIPHTYFTTDRSDEDFSTLLSRFLIAGEGRIDHIGGYMDGFRIWETLFKSKYAGFIRGDHNFGWSRIYNTDEVYNSLSIRTADNYGNLEAIKSMDLPEQKMPDYFMRVPGESIPALRDRLYSQFRVPCVLAALNDIKMPFIEVYNPLMTFRLNRFIQSLPDDLRTGKKLLKDLIHKLSPDIPFTKYEAILTQDRVVQEFEIAGYLKSEIHGISTNSILPQKLLRLITDKIQLDTDKLKKRSAGIITYQKIRSSLPSWSKSLIKRSIPKKNIDFNLLAFRALILNKMHLLLKEDAMVLRGK